MKRLSLDAKWFPTTSLWKIWKNLWEFTITSEWNEKMANFETMCWDILKENSIINKKWIKQIIKYIKKSLTEKKSYDKKDYAKVSWVKNPANIKFHCCFNSRFNILDWWVVADNKMRKNFRYTPSDYDIMENWGEDPINHTTWPYSEVTEQNLKKYIWDLQEEIWEEREYDKEWNEVKK